MSSCKQSLQPLTLSELKGVEAAKRAAAYAAVDNHVKREHTVIGIGSGSTVPFAVERIIQQGSEVNQNRWFIPTGFQSKELIIRGGLRLGDIDAFTEVDVAIDGADEIDDHLNAIKGGGACQLREKVLAQAATTFIMVADYRKNSKILGTTWTQGVPIEVAEFGWSRVKTRLEGMGSSAATLRMGKMKAGPVVTDNGNLIIDAVFSPTIMKDPKDLFSRIKQFTGVVEVGLFVNMCEAAYFGNSDGSITSKSRDGKVVEGIQFDVLRDPSLS
ncbi:hypothetical protein CBS101457_001650 [Exobasidium rhododendri]|nr:hypothetical protein CBS101457_001650 [Exobasidium rhododendri]